jgi:shikimate dehydrogenase
MSVDRYAVIGHPIEHSRSPLIHQQFAAQTGQAIDYRKLFAPLDGFTAMVSRWFDEGGRGLNVTVPFKLEAFAMADRISARAEAAGAANVLTLGPEGLLADNTDGAGLVCDIEQRLRLQIRGAGILLIGAGGAARGVLQPLLDAGAARIHIANRSPARAHELAAAFDGPAGSRITAGDLTAIPAGLDLSINATSSGLGSGGSPIEAEALTGTTLAYDMVYGAEPTAFMRAARLVGVGVISDGLGMLVEQAAESFLIWRGVRPDTEPVYNALRRELSPQTGSQNDERSERAG